MGCSQLPGGDHLAYPAADAAGLNARHLALLDVGGNGMAENVAKIIASTPYFKDGFSFQTGVGGPSLAAHLFLEAAGRPTRE